MPPPFPPDDDPEVKTNAPELVAEEDEPVFNSM